MDRLGYKFSTVLERKQTSKRNLIEDNSPDSYLYTKITNELKKHAFEEKKLNEADLFNCVKELKELTKKSKYQMKVLEQRLLKKVIFPILNEKNNLEINRKCSKIISNIIKNKNNFYKIIPEITILLKEVLNILIIYFNSNLTPDILKIFLIMTENKEILLKLSKGEENFKLELEEKFFKKNLPTSKETNSNPNDIRNKNLNLFSLVRIFIEKILDDLTSSNKNILLKIVQNIYEFDSALLNEESMEPIIRCLGDKDQNVVISSLNIILIYASDKSFHQTLVNNNLIYRLIMIYKQGIIDMDVILVKILLIFYDTKNMHEILFESKIVLILQNYLTNYKEVENEEFFRNLFEIFKKIITIQPLNNPVKEDKNLQAKIFEKAVSLSQNTKKEKIMLSCLSTIDLMINQYSAFLLQTDDQLMNTIENIPVLLKSKNIEILKYSLSIFEKILKKDKNFFIDKYAKNNERNLNVKNIIHSIIGLINEFFSDYEIIKISCKILIELSQSGNLYNYFLKEPQITILRVFNENLIIERTEYLKETEKTLNILNKEKKRLKENSTKSPQKESFSSEEASLVEDRKSIFIRQVQEETMNKRVSKSKENKKKKKDEEESKTFVEKRIKEISLILKESVHIIANLTKYEENLEILTNKGFLDIINKMLNSQNLEELSKITQCIEGFCKSTTAIDIMLNENMLFKILNTYKHNAYNIKIAEKALITAKKKNFESKLTISSNNLQALSKNNKYHQIHNEHSAEDRELIEKIRCKKDILNSLKKILESDIKLQKQFINDQGILILLEDVVFTGRLSESTDEVNANVLKVLYVITYNINKLFINYFTNKSETEMEEFLENENEFIQSLDSSRFKSSESEMESNDAKSVDFKNTIRKPAIFINNQNDNDHVFDNIHNFKKQLSKDLFMSKLIGIGKNESTSAGTYKEVVKILINLYLNRYYLQYFTIDSVFVDVMNVIERILLNLKRKTDYDIVKLLLIFLKFICEEEKLIKRFLESSIISKLLGILNSPDFYNQIDKEELSQFYYNTSLVILRLSEFKGFSNRFNFNDNFLGVLENLYDNNSMNGKIYVVNIIKNILSEKSNFFEEDKILKFINKIVSQNNTIVIYEFLELIRVLVHNRNICKKMENVFKYLITEIKSSSYSPKFKKRILEIILCLSYENSNIKDFALKDLFILIKDLDIKINKKTKLLILMNFSSISSNFSYLRTITEKRARKSELDDSTQHMFEKIEGMSIKKNELIEIINQLLDSDRFSQILIQRLLLNITCIDDIDLSIISEKIFEMLIQIITTCKTMQDSIVVFTLSVLINLSNRNIFKRELSIEANKKKSVIIKETEENYETLIEEEPDNSLDISIIQDYKNKTSVNNISNHLESESNNNLKEMRLVDYIIERIPNLVTTIEDLFSMNNLDISALTIMFACNISKKIVKHGKTRLDENITNCIEGYFFEHSESFSDSDSGKIYIIAILRFCESLFEDGNKIVAHKKLYETVYEFLLQREKEKMILIKLNKDDLNKNTINYMLVEAYIKFLNVIFEIETKLALFTHLDLSKDITDYYLALLKDFSEIFVSDTNNKIEMNYSLQDFIITLFHMLVNFQSIKNFENINCESIQRYITKIILNLIKYEPDKLTEDLKSLMIYVFYIIVEKQFQNADLVRDKECETVLKIESIKWLIKSFKIPANSLQTDYYSLELFIKYVNMEKPDEIFWKSNKFINKLGNYLKSSNEDEKFVILKHEAVKFLNIISFNFESHQKLYQLGIYNHFKTNLYLKQGNEKEIFISRDEIVILVNMIINKENEEFVKDDIASLMKLIFLCKDLDYNIFVELFDVYISYTIKNSDTISHKKKKVFKEDYLILFNLLYDNLKSNFSEMIFLIGNFAKDYENFAHQLVKDEEIILKIYSDFCKFDKNFPSLFEEFEAFLTILIYYVNYNLNKKIEEMIIDLMKKIINNKSAMSNINILKSTIGFIFYFYFKSIDINKNLLQTESQLGEYLQRFNFSEFIKLLCINAIEKADIANIYLLCSIIFKDVYKPILKYLKTVNNFLFTKDFVLCFFGSLINLESIDIREFVYVINIVNNLNAIDNSSLPGLEEFLSQALNIYDKFLVNSIGKNENLSLNYFIGSLYFFCDLIKVAKGISGEMFSKVVRFFINILQNFNLNSEQKEILIKYYQEILANFKIKSVEDLKLIMTFFLKIHYDKDFNYIEILVMETIIENTEKDVILKQFESFLQMTRMIFPTEFDKTKIWNFLNISKNIFYKINQSVSSLIKTANNKFKALLLELFPKFENEIKNDLELNDKYTKFRERLNAIM